MCGPGGGCGYGFERRDLTKEDKMKALDRYERGLKEALEDIDELRGSLKEEK